MVYRLLVFLLSMELPFNHRIIRTVDELYYRESD
ncbi:uncharacterized protein METZ01_LOCUS137815 [marine metagenome]|uniref:Uncharacterized protein n=1 Tax=marine metagenome TaxID=408172 RepID=A0A381Z7N8_9ZZZZ